MDMTTEELAQAQSAQEKNYAMETCGVTYDATASNYELPGDEVRRYAALQCAINAASDVANAADIVNAARIFDAYLKGE